MTPKGPSQRRCRCKGRALRGPERQTGSSVGERMGVGAFGGHCKACASLCKTLSRTITGCRAVEARSRDRGNTLPSHIVGGQGCHWQGPSACTLCGLPVSLLPTSNKDGRTFCSPRPLPCSLRHIFSSGSGSGSGLGSSHLSQLQNTPRLSTKRTN